MTQARSFRIPQQSAGQFGSDLDRDKALRFRFDDQPFEGYSGDTLASALLANGVRNVGRSFKFHRPRGVFSSGLEEPNAVVQLEVGARAVPSARAPVVELYQGLQAFSYHGWPNRNWDFGRVLDLVSPVWAAGFYNKTFIWPSWHPYERLVRRTPPNGRAPTGPDPDHYHVQHAHCEVLVIGGGEAGLKAALESADEGVRVVLADASAKLGGRCVWDGSTVDGQPGPVWVKTATERLAQAAEVRVLRRTTAVGSYEQGVVALLERVPQEGARNGAPRERYWIVRADRVVLATGAVEQPLVFCNNDRPGILLASAAHEYLRRQAVAVGRRVLVATNNDSAYPVAADLKRAGVEVIALLDVRDEVPEDLVRELQDLGIPLHPGSMPVDTHGFSGLSSVDVARLPRGGNPVQVVQRVACDALAVSGGWTPLLHLYSQAGGRLVYSEHTAALEPFGAHPTVAIRGVASGAAGTASLLGRWGREPGIRISPVGPTSRQWIDLRHDVTVSDLELAVRENYSAIEHVKRYTTVGMASDQGKTSNLAALEVIADLQHQSAAALGHTTLRPPFVPVTLGAIAGGAIRERFTPFRELPMHDWHVGHGAVLEDFGPWKRPAVYLGPGESRAEAIARECRAVRIAVGLFDGSALGKIEIHGPDALEFLNHFYINDLTTLQPLRVRYGFMLRESGVVFDDGTVVKLAPDRWLITTTSANATRVAAWLQEWHQCEWPRLRVAIFPVTEQWACISLAGPRAREVLTKLETNIDCSPAAFPHLSLRQGHLLGHPARIYRVSFTGELSYEINVPAGAGSRVWGALLDAGRLLGLVPFGVDALMLLRLEKGFLHIGTDTDGTTVPEDIGWGRTAAKKSSDFIGKRSLILPENVRPDRRQLIGLSADKELVVGSHLRVTGSHNVTDGWITSAGRSVFSGSAIALAVLNCGRSRVGTEVSVHNEGVVSHARVVNPPFFDPTGARANG
jgi:sarcosine oxidase subunit alpha